MSENEAIKELQINKPFTASKQANNAIDMAIQALKKQSMVNELLHECKEMEIELEKYRAIGTIEEFKALKEKSVAKKAKGIRKYDEAYCPACNEVIADDEFWELNEYVHHCNYCGQAVKGVDWQ